MAKLSFGAYPHMLGFEQLEQLLERTEKSSNEGYPPFNIEQTSDRSFRISLAVAGFSEAELSITLEDRQLVIQGKKHQETATKIFLHRGIATRQFQRSFVLADGIEVGEAFMDIGLLHIDLVQNIPANIIQKIEIKTHR
jgi:HSP20 family molecular chaperone IbpA|tara:strand:+ start:1004 stop:1420 length:417 start_codon:yes stop_codon:yes gene_type:complete